jgi:nicotinate-nucleotide adenylyltransferase|tara:strand:+ start:846 stop:1427 length:582 start_codon:yes stop_codon:yes gene_type:complete
VKKIGLYFGTFNPIHKGHLTLGNYFSKHTDLDEVWFVVTVQNPFKANDALLEDNHRLKMVRLALEDQNNLKVCAIEFSLPTPSYTIDTLDHIVKMYPNEQFVLLMGEDNLIYFDKWKKYQRILDLVQLYVYPRKHEIAVPEAIIKHYKIQVVNAPKLDFASENIRRILSEGNSAEALMPPGSWEYLNEKGFYK